MSVYLRPITLNCLHWLSLFFHRTARSCLNRSCTTTSTYSSPNLTSSHLLEMWVSLSTAFHISRFISGPLYSRSAPKFSHGRGLFFFFHHHFYLSLIFIYSCKCSWRGKRGETTPVCASHAIKVFTSETLSLIITFESWIKGTKRIQLKSLLKRHFLKDSPVLVVQKIFGHLHS